MLKCPQVAMNIVRVPRMERYVDIGGVTTFPLRITPLGPGAEAITDVNLV